MQAATCDLSRYHWLHRPANGVGYRPYLAVCKEQNQYARDGHAADIWHHLYAGLQIRHCRGRLALPSPAGGRNVSDNGHAGVPTVLRMILGKQLQGLRERAGLSYEEAAGAIYSSPWTVRRMERAEGGLKPLAVKGLLMAYGITDVREIDAFLTLSKEASRAGWWHRYNDVLPGWFRTFVGLEEAAAAIRGYDPHWIPGLLQTPDYARASVQVGFPDAPASEAERRVALRLARQQLLNRETPPRLWLVMDENVLRRPAATTGTAVMQAQIDTLIEAA